MSTTNDTTPPAPIEPDMVDETGEEIEPIEVMAIETHENGYDISLAIPMEISDARFHKLMMRFCYAERCLRTTKKGKPPAEIALIQKAEPDEDA